MDLASDERVIFRGHPSWRSILGYYVKALALTVLAGALAALVTRVADDEVKWSIVSTVAVAILALAVVVGLLKRIATTYTITSERLHIRRGIVARRTQEARLERVQNVNTTQSALQRLLQVGTVDFDTAGTDDSEFQFVGVANPDEVVSAVDGAQRGTAPAATEQRSV